MSETSDEGKESRIPPGSGRECSNSPTTSIPGGDQGLDVPKQETNDAQSLVEGVQEERNKLRPIDTPLSVMVDLSAKFLEVGH